MFPFGGSAGSGIPIRPRLEWEIANLSQGFEWSENARRRAVEVIAAVVAGELESGVLDRPRPVLRPVGDGGVLGRTNPPAVALPGPIAVAHDWGHVLRQAGAGFLSGFAPTGGGPIGPAIGPQINLPEMPAMLGGPPQADCATYERCGTNRYLTYDCKTQEFKPRSRRRRRRLLTGRDISDLAALQAIAGKGAALQMAIATAVRR